MTVYNVHIKSDFQGTAYYQRHFDLTMDIFLVLNPLQQLFPTADTVCDYIRNNIFIFKLFHIYLRGGFHIFYFTLNVDIFFKPINQNYIIINCEHFPCLFTACFVFSLVFRSVEVTIHLLYLINGSEKRWY